MSLQPNDMCFSCGRKRPQKLEQKLHEYYESLRGEADPWIQLEGWTEFFLDPEKIRASDDQQFWFISLCPECSKKLACYIVDSCPTLRKAKP